MKALRDNDLPTTISMRTAGMGPQLRRWKRKHPYAPWSLLLRRAVNGLVPPIKHRKEAA